MTAQSTAWGTRKGSVPGQQRTDGILTEISDRQVKTVPSVVPISARQSVPLPSLDPKRTFQRDTDEGTNSDDNSGTSSDSDDGFISDCDSEEDSDLDWLQRILEELAEGGKDEEGLHCEQVAPLSQENNPGCGRTMGPAELPELTGSSHDKLSNTADLLSSRKSPPAIFPEEGTQVNGTADVVNNRSTDYMDDPILHDIMSCGPNSTAKKSFYPDVTNLQFRKESFGPPKYSSAALFSRVAKHALADPDAHYSPEHVKLLRKLSNGEPEAIQYMDRCFYLADFRQALIDKAYDVMSTEPTGSKGDKLITDALSRAAAQGRWTDAGYDMIDVWGLKVNQKCLSDLGNMVGKLGRPCD
ncbi:hypothetical protein M231_03938 [Tremella mesenterica]|uniref:Uncharacterized protein n=1 Tax=Tremella mesenterica TaxID=5217 RepID=A0A4Q1BM87_TREME|nr:uncharacterized protein TREMEDRAFT_64823 [Tremella mesenterica DSM 1558]EIW66963.1 hypothetical protein TREMEDRAFT_64823 [Tremella mesenterica DSM 1558]RXK38762.1 hypothetical protein M231_03938 [Tremella mesenterica]